MKWPKYKKYYFPVTKSISNKKNFFCWTSCFAFKNFWQICNSFRYCKYIPFTIARHNVVFNRSIVYFRELLSLFVNDILFIVTFFVVMPTDKAWFIVLLKGKSAKRDVLRKPHATRLACHVVLYLRSLVKCISSLVWVIGCAYVKTAGSFEILWIIFWYML